MLNLDLAHKDTLNYSLWWKLAVKRDKIGCNMQSLIMNISIMVLKNRISRLKNALSCQNDDRKWTKVHAYKKILSSKYSLGT